MITSVDDRTVLRQALDAGANDFLTKPVDEVELTARVRNMLSLRAYALELKQMATIDALTGTYNRRHFFQMAEKEFSRVRRYGSALSVLMLDADHFKQVNDHYGHAGGDAVLTALGDICCRQLREIDFIGRIGGEEFAVCMLETPLDQATDAAQRLCQAIESSAVMLGVDEIKYTVSIGCTEMAEDDQTFATVLDRADRALYQAKQGGRNQVAAG